jgi:hypothetical protein
MRLTKELIAPGIGTDVTGPDFNRCKEKEK